MSRVRKVFIYLMAILCGSLTAWGQAPVLTTGSAAAMSVLRGHDAGITSVRFSNDGAWLGSSSLDGTVRLWSTRTWKTERILNHGSEIYAIAFSQNTDLLVSGGYDQRLIFWETKSGKLLRTVKFPDWIVAAAFIPTGQLAVGCADGIVRFVDPGTGVINRTLDTKGEIVSLDVSADGRYLATGIPVRMWDLATGELLTKDVRAFGQNGLSFSPSAQLLASAEGTGGARVLSVPVGERRESLRLEVQKKVLGPSGYDQVTVNMPVSAIAFSRNGTWLATGGTDFGVQLWQVTGDVVAKMPARVLSGHTMTVTGVSFSPDGSLLASASLDRTVRLWKLR